MDYCYLSRIIPPKKKILGSGRMLTYKSLKCPKGMFITVYKMFYFCMKNKFSSQNKLKTASNYNLKKKKSTMVVVCFSKGVCPNEFYEIL